MSSLKVRKVSALALLIVAIAAFAVGLAFGQLAGYTLIKPFRITITVVETSLKVNSLSFTYDPASNQYTKATVSGKNYDTTAAHYGKVYVVLKDSAGNTVASGSADIGSSTSPIDANTAFGPIDVPLSWESGKTVADVANGYLWVEQLG
jgi:hypothetical protein